MDPYLEAKNSGFDDFVGKVTKRVGSLIARSPASWEMACNPICSQIMHAILGYQVLNMPKRYMEMGEDRLMAPGYRTQPWQLHLSQIIAIGASETAQSIHRDRWAFVFDFTEVEVEVSSMWAVGTDFTLENGATRVVPGSYKLPRGRKVITDDMHITQAVMPRGSAMFYLGSSFHSGGENRSGKMRYGVNWDWNLAWLRQEENQYLSVPPAIAKDLPLHEYTFEDREPSHKPPRTWFKSNESNGQQSVPTIAITVRGKAGISGATSIAQIIDTTNEFQKVFEQHRDMIEFKNAKPTKSVRKTQDKVKKECPKGNPAPDTEGKCPKNMIPKPNPKVKDLCCYKQQLTAASPT